MKGKLYVLWYNALKWHQKVLLKKSQRQVKKLTQCNKQLAEANARVLEFEKTVVYLMTGKTIE